MRRQGYDADLRACCTECETVKAGRVERYSVLAGVLAAAILSAIVAVQAIIWGFTRLSDAFGVTGLIVLATVGAGLVWLVTRERAR